jgi:hypothetical protein
MKISTSTLKPFALGQGNLESIQSRVSYVEPNQLRISYEATGDIAQLRIPARSSPRRSDRLWENTCFEAFLRVDGDSPYYEFNFSPSGEWAAYEFRGYRDGGPIANDDVAPAIVVRRSADRIELDAVVHLDRLPAIRLGSLLRIGLAAVLEAHDGRLSYWALEHPAAKPDFHHPDSFALELAFSSQSA